MDWSCTPLYTSGKPFKITFIHYEIEQPVPFLVTFVFPVMSRVFFSQQGEQQASTQQQAKTWLKRLNFCSVDRCPLHSTTSSYIHCVVHMLLTFVKSTTIIFLSIFSTSPWWKCWKSAWILCRRRNKRVVNEMGDALFCCRQMPWCHQKQRVSMLTLIDY